MKIYAIGAFGSGVAALLNILKDLDEEVMGADISGEFYTKDKIKDFKIDLIDEIELEKAYFYVIGNAFKNHKITKKIISEGYQYAYYPKFIESYFQMPKIGISGTHGKTTCTTFLNTLMVNKCNALIGDGTGYGVKNSKYLLIEACEYQKSFLNYSYEYLVVLNIDYDHPDYYQSKDEYLDAFKEATKKTKYLVCNHDDKNCLLLNHPNRITFGFNEKSDLLIIKDNDQIILKYQNKTYTFNLPFHAIGYIYDFAAAFLVCLLLNENIAQVEENFKLLTFPKRRLNKYFDEAKTNIYIDDYAHHPTEIKNVISEVKNTYIDKEIIAIFEPHTYTRSKAFYKEFKDALSEINDVYIFKNFSSIREKETTDITFGYPLYNDFIREKLLLKTNVIIMFLGAGMIGNELKLYQNG